MQFYNIYDKKPPKVFTKLDTDTVHVSQSEVETSSLAYQLKRYGMDTLQARFDAMKSKFGYADCTKNNDFATLQNKYRASVDYFEALPSEIRRKFHDKPEEFYESIQKDPKLAYEHGYISDEQYQKMVDTSHVVEKSNLVDLSTSAEISTDTTQEPVESAQSASA